MVSRIQGGQGDRLLGELRGFGVIALAGEGARDPRGGHGIRRTQDRGLHIGIDGRDNIVDRPVTIPERQPEIGQLGMQLDRLGVLVERLAVVAGQLIDVSHRPVALH